MIYLNLICVNNIVRPDQELNLDILSETSFRDSRSTIVPSGHGYGRKYDFIMISYVLPETF